MDIHKTEMQGAMERFLESEQEKDLLRFITCGSVDDGKSTLIGRLLYEARQIYDDQLTSLASDSARVGTRGSEIDFALLVDGLAAEREQGITIDVAYRYFATARRKYVVADTPGHEQYTRNMVTGASTADVAVLLVDARKGILVQTKRHSFIASLLGIRHVVVAVNKMDLVGYDSAVFERILADFQTFSAAFGFVSSHGVPICAVDGDNIVESSKSMGWYAGPPLLRYLDNLSLERPAGGQKFLMPVQWVNRRSADFRGYAGRVVSGEARPGLRLRVLPSGLETTVARLVTADGDLGVAGPGQSITITLGSEVDVSRGDVLSEAADTVDCASKFEATVVWMHEDALLQGREYVFKLGSRTALATVAPLKYRVNVNTLEHQPAERLELNDIGVCELSIDQAIPFRPYTEDREMGGFILIDRLTNHTVGAGMLHFALRRSENVHWQTMDVDRTARSAQKGQRGCVVWMTGLSGAGKSTIANILERKLVALGRHTYLLDGDNVRHGLNKDLGFTQQDRVENIRRVAEVAALMADAGLITVVAFISPFRAERQMARDLLPAGEFVEVHIDTPLAVAEARDIKGLYRKARSGKLANFTGIDSPYEAPESPEVPIDTSAVSADEAADQILSALVRRGLTAPAGRK